MIQLDDDPYNKCLYHRRLDAWLSTLDPVGERWVKDLIYGALIEDHRNTVAAMTRMVESEVHRGYMERANHLRQANAHLIEFLDEAQDEVQALKKHLSLVDCGISGV